MPFPSPGWLFAPRTLQSLENLTNAYGEPLLASAGLLTINAQDGTSGMLMGFPFFTTNNVPINQTYGTANNASTIVFASDWSEAFFGDWQSLAIDSSSEAS
jgi:HK97 family phage major capsid protein